MNLSNLAQTVLDNVNGNIANTSIGNYIAQHTSSILNDVTQAIADNIEDPTAEGHSITLPCFNDIAGITGVTALQFNTSDLVNAINDQAEVAVSILQNNQQTLQTYLNADYLNSVVNDFVSESNALIDIAGCLESNGNDVDIMMKIQNLASTYPDNSAGSELFNRVKKFVSLNTSGDKMAALRQLVVSLLSNDDSGYSSNADVLQWTNNTLGSDSTGCSPFKAWAASVDLTLDWNSIKSKIGTVFEVAYKGLQTIANTIAKGILTGIRKIKESTVDPLIYKSTDRKDFDGLNTPLITWRLERYGVTASTIQSLLNEYVPDFISINDAAQSFDSKYIYEFSLPGAVIDLLRDDVYVYIGYRPKLYSNHMGVYNDQTQLWHDIATPSEYITEAAQSAVSNWDGTPWQWPVPITGGSYSDSDDHRFGMGLDSGRTLFGDFIKTAIVSKIGHTSDTFPSGVGYISSIVDALPVLGFTAKINPTIADVITNVSNKTTINRSWNVPSGSAPINSPAWTTVDSSLVGKCYADNYRSLYVQEDWDDELNKGKLVNYIGYPYVILGVLAYLKESNDFFPYSKGYMMSQGSIDFMTDQDQADKFAKFLKGVGIGVVTIVASIVIFKTYRKMQNKLAATRGQLWTNLGTYNGSQEQANLIRKLTWKEKLFSSLLGRSSSLVANAAVATSAGSFNSYGQKGIDKADSIYHAITGSNI